MPDIITLIANAGGTLGLALFAIFMLNRVWEARMLEEREHSEQMRTVWEQTRLALECNTRVITELLCRIAPKVGDPLA
jgi:hypothetical protein